MLAADVSAALAALEPFKSGPLEGARVAPSLYVVKSYGAAVAAVTPGMGRLVTLDPVSPTSGRHAGQVRAAWQGSQYLDVGQPVLDSAVRRNT